MKSVSHQPFELLLSEAHVLGRDAVVEVKAGVEDQRVVCVQGVVGLVLPEPEHRQNCEPIETPSQVAVNSNGLRDDRVLGEVWVTGSRQFTGNRTDLLWEHQSSRVSPTPPSSCDL